METLKLSPSLLSQFEELDTRAQILETERIRLENVNKTRAREQLLQIRLLLDRKYPRTERG